MPDALSGSPQAEGGPVVCQALPWRDPADVFGCLADDPALAWLDSQGPALGRGRFSYLCVEPFQILVAEAADPDPLPRLAGLLAAYRQTGTAGPVPFAGGAVGFLGYELANRLDRVPRPAADGTDIPDFWFGLYDLILAFDRQDERLWLISSGLPETRPAARRLRARHRAEHLLRRLSRPGPATPQLPPLAWQPEVTAEEHIARVARTIGLIAAGDISQANITARFFAARPQHATAADIHRALRAGNPAPYGAYLACGDRLAIASVSPERFLGLTADGAIEARPIKGTRPRAAAPAQDAAHLAELLASEKDFAENLMIVDLMRNDIGRVADIGSVTVPELARPESFAHVHHLVSSVRGRLRAGLSATDLLRATFPGGSVTGAPKVRAMQVIAEVERAARGPYCGAVAWLGWDGAMDSSIAIRTLTITPQAVIAQAGGGIVADSDPAAEYEELMVKIRPLLAALGPLPA